MEMVAEGRVGSSEQRHPRHLAAEGHAPVRLHAFSTGYSSDSASLSLRHTHGRYSDSHSREAVSVRQAVNWTVNSIKKLLVTTKKCQNLLVVVVITLGSHTTH